MKIIDKPTEASYAPFYKTYIDLVEGDLNLFMEKQLHKFNDICKNIPEANTLYRYEPGKWSIKELVGHCIDTERIMAYRLLRITRADQTALAGFDENEYVKNANFDKIAWDDLIEEFNVVRKSTMFLINSLTADQVKLMGTANGLTISADALLYIIAGHLEHHLGILIRRYSK